MEKRSFSSRGYALTGMSSPPERYLELLEDDQQTLLALAACSAALQLDDKTACQAIEIIAQSNGTTSDLMRRVKNLGCVWIDWNTLWHVSGSLRRSLLERLYREIPAPTITKLRECLAEKAAARANGITGEDPLSQHQKLLARFEAAYQRVLLPGKSEEGAKEIIELWSQSSKQDADALAHSVDFLADEILQLLGRPPDEILFLRGIAAQVRSDNHAQKKYFRRLWKRARRGNYHQQIHAIAAKIYGLLIEDRDPTAAESALWDSIAWRPDSPPLPGDLGQLIELSDELPIDAGVVMSQPSLYQEMSQFALEHFPRTGQTLNASDFVEDLYKRFFETQLDMWESQSDFFGYASRLIRRILIHHALSKYTANLRINHSRESESDKFGAEPEAYLLTLDEAISRLHKIDPKQSRIVELIYYGGLTIEKTAEVLQIPGGIVAHEWRTAKAFLKAHLTNRKGVLTRLNFPSLMTTATLSVELR
jgi:RNA polymerase sigma factor (TIGR02999 family)